MIGEYRDLLTKQGVYLAPDRASCHAEAIVNILFRSHHLFTATKRDAAQGNTTTGTEDLDEEEKGRHKSQDTKEDHGKEVSTNLSREGELDQGTGNEPDNSSSHS